MQANLYWWETAHRIMDANDGCGQPLPTLVDLPASPAQVRSCFNSIGPATCDQRDEMQVDSTGLIVSSVSEHTSYLLRLGSIIAWGYGLFNVLFLTYISVNMFVAVITTVFADVSSSKTLKKKKSAGQSFAVSKSPAALILFRRLMGMCLYVLGAVCREPGRRDGGQGGEGRSGL